MDHKETPPEAEPTSQGGLFQTLGAIGASIARKLKLAVMKPDPVHPDFTMVHVVDEELTWFQNIDWGPFPDPAFKVGFYFNDPSVLNNCPWVCKFGKNLNKKFPHQYFCVGYGDPAKWQSDFGLKEMKKWVMQFDHPSLMTYEGKLLKMLKE